MQNQNNQVQSPANLPGDDDEINLMDMMLVIAKYNRFIIAFTAISVVLAFIYALRQPTLYTANALIMPPQAPMSQAGMLMGQLSSLGLGSGSGSGSGTSLSILIKSQKIAYQVVDKLDLQSLFKAKNIEAARNTLSGSTKITTNKDGTILIEYTDKDPKIAALIVGTYIDELDRFNSKIAITTASRTRLYFEKQLKFANEELAKLELAMKESQKNTDLTPLEVQTGLMTNLIATLRGQITSKELELANLRSFATEENPQYRKTNLSLAILRAQLIKLESDNEVRDKDEDGIKGSAKTGSKFFNNMRDLKYQQALVESLKRQYDVARMDEAKDANLIQVINEPLVPENPSKPQRKFIMMIGTFLGLIIGIILAFIMNNLDAAKQNPQSAERLNLLRRYFQRGK
jgi:uncharacterized protein involved in exopolysaccharide biosynthesis